MSIKHLRLKLNCLICMSNICMEVMVLSQSTYWWHKMLTQTYLIISCSIFQYQEVHQSGTMITAIWRGHNTSNIICSLFYYVMWLAKKEERRLHKHFKGKGFKQSLRISKSVATGVEFTLSEMSEPWWKKIILRLSKCQEWCEPFFMIYFAFST